VIEALEPRVLWYDCTEDFTGWPGLPGSARAQIGTTDRWLTDHAHVVTTVSSTLYHEKSRLNPNTHWVPNAVDADLFLQSAVNLQIPRDLVGASRPVLAFVGGLSDWAHDWGLLDEVARARPDWTVLLIGRESLSQRTLRMLRSHPGILMVGQKPYCDLPAYLLHSDICFQFYRPDRCNDTRNSQKLFLYLAAGKPVVSTPSADAQAYSRFARIVTSAEAFVLAVESVLREDSAREVKARQDFALENSWSARVQQVVRILADAM
jgi:hypothetical protein